MTKQASTTRKKTVFKANPDAIIVAPLHQAKQDLPLADLGKKGSELADPHQIAAAPIIPHLVYNGGPLMANVQVYTIFWGKNWNTTPALKMLMTQINDFFKAILVSPLMDQLTEYNVPAYTIGHGNLAGTKIITAAAPTLSVSDTTIKSNLKAWINAQTVPKQTPNTLYFVYTEPNISVSMGGSKSCSSFCGYHNNIPLVGGSQIYYAVMPYPSCLGCLGGLTTFNALCATSSHELCEAITDPIPGAGWYDNANGEIGDICPWKFKQVGAYTVQLEWSNKLNKCV
jgi:hypothetical protein